jgi:hypothetical protein
MKEKMGNLNIGRNRKRKNNYMEVHKLEFRLETIPTLMMEPNAPQGLPSSIENKKNLPIPKCVAKCKLRAHSLTLKKKQIRSSKTRLGRIHK